ncbi:MAG: 16S rRNA (cytosine(1402)-N(4))-methyltransferase, partial [Lachnospiraceae bacterium]|nr:16S rRNA (cytosine(1402)-N(4))-methyltransferase [Lachnospiraceae bacterium]
EDRMVKKMFKEQKKQGLYSEISADAVRPTEEECRRNPRARSAKLRWVVK